MQCPACRHENRVGRRFCGGCGGALPIACPRCGAPDEDGERFCAQCGAGLTNGAREVTPERRPLRDAREYTPKHLAERILHSRAAIEGERKQVIVLFADFLLRRGLGGAPTETLAVRVASYALILLIGLAMLVRGIHRARVPSTHAHQEHACACGARHGESGLLSLGVGLVPCTGSLLILIYSMANGILAVGIALVAMIAVGMAVTMGALGLASVLARRLVAERLTGGAGRAALALDLVGAGAITLLGAVLLAGALRS